MVLDGLWKSFPDAKPTDRLLPTKSLQAVLTTACKEVQASGLKCRHLSHHDLRHIAATRWIEEGIDIMTVASWLGHRDNGRTALLIYGHLRQAHSQQEAAKLKTRQPVVEQDMSFSI